MLRKHLQDGSRFGSRCLLLKNRQFQSISKFHFDERGFIVWHGPFSWAFADQQHNPGAQHNPGPEHCARAHRFIFITL